MCPQSLTCPSEGWQYALWGCLRETQASVSICMNLSKRVIALLYLLLIVYCSTWIPWCEDHQTSYRRHAYDRVGYGWVWAGPRLFVEEPDPSTKHSPVPTEKDQDSRWTVVEEESMHLVVKGGLSYAEPDIRLIGL